MRRKTVASEFRERRRAQQQADRQEIARLDDAEREVIGTMRRTDKDFHYLVCCVVASLAEIHPAKKKPTVSRLQFPPVA